MKSSHKCEIFWHTVKIFSKTGGRRSVQLTSNDPLCNQLLCQLNWLFIFLDYTLTLRSFHGCRTSCCVSILLVYMRCSYLLQSVLRLFSIFENVCQQTQCDATLTPAVQSTPKSKERLSSGCVLPQTAMADASVVLHVKRSRHQLPRKAHELNSHLFIPVFSCSIIKFLTVYFAVLWRAFSVILAFGDVFVFFLVTRFLMHHL